MNAAEEQLRLLSQVTEQITQSFVVTNLEYEITFVNKAFVRLFGYTKEDLLGQTPEILNVETTAAEVQQDIYRTVAAGGIWKGEALNRRKDGSTFLCEFTVQPLLDDQGNPYAHFGIQRDITERRRVEEELAKHREHLEVIVEERTRELREEISERKRAEAEKIKLQEQLHHSQKLESLGILAGGIAHDFNNILTGLLGNADLALCDLPSRSPVRPLLDDIRKAGRRAADLTGQMLAYSGKGRFVVEDVDINALVRDMSSLLESSISKKVALKYELASALPSVHADATQLRQIVLNLISNASEAVGDEGGLVRLSTDTTECRHAKLDGASVHGKLTDGRYVTIEVTDTGCGMDAETKARVFEPFFTTKFTGRGLGLAAVEGIVRGHKGAILVESALDEGTTFKVLLPALDRPAQAAATEPKEEGAWHVTGTILVVDDEEVVRRVATRMLTHLGMSVLTASDGVEAVEMFRERHGEIACVLLDLKMPRLDGEETFEELRKIDRGVPVILTSGYGEHESTKRFGGKGLAGFLQKPYQVESLKEKLRMALGA